MRDPKDTSLGTLTQAMNQVRLWNLVSRRIIPSATLPRSLPHPAQPGTPDAQAMQKQRVNVHWKLTDRHMRDLDGGSREATHRFNASGSTSVTSRLLTWLDMLACPPGLEARDSRPLNAYISAHSIPTAPLAR